VQFAARQKNFPPEYFLAAGRGYINIINMKEIKFDGFHHFSEKFCLGVGFSSQVSIASVESRISANKLKLCISVVPPVTCNQTF